MMEMVEERLAEMKELGTTIAVVEAAVLTRAGWDKRCHEIWSVIVPPNEVRKFYLFRKLCFYTMLLYLQMQETP
jgi:dephospho-CoA kinase